MSRLLATSKKSGRAKPVDIICSNRIDGGYMDSSGNTASFLENLAGREKQQSVRYLLDSIPQHIDEVQASE